MKNQRSFSLRRIKPSSVALIATLAIVSLAAFVGTQSGQAHGGAVAPQIEGSWRAIVNSPDVPGPFPVLLTFGSGGALIVTDGSFPPAAGNIYQGTWARKGGHEIAFSFLGFQYKSEILTGYIRVRETVRLNQSGNSYHSVFSTLEFLDVNQNVLEGPLSATTHGTRIHPQ